MQQEFQFLNKASEDQNDSVPENLLILDTETTGLNPKQDQCIEVGAVLFNVKFKTPLSQLSFLLPVSENQAESINKIPAEITKIDQPYLYALDYFKCLIDRADALFAHNAEFDRQWFGTDLLPGISKPWICSMEDMKWPYHLNLKSRPSVSSLALAYGIPVWTAHRALTDCIYLVEVLKRCEDLEQMLSKALEPRRLMRAQVSYEDRHLAKNAGFRWNDPVRGAWTRRLSDQEVLDLDFPVSPIDAQDS